MGYRMTIVRRLAIMAASGAILVLTGTGTASAAVVEGRDYANHVRACQQEMGFSGTHNPGMHHGNSGWDPTHTC